MAINVIVVVGLNLLVGYTGQFSLGHAGFFAIGAYATIALMTKAHFPFLLALPCAGLVTALFGFLLGLPALRLEGPYLAIATLGFGITATQVIGKIKMFGERQGLHAPKLTIGPWQIESDKDFYFVLIPITISMTPTIPQKPKQASSSCRKRSACLPGFPAWERRPDWL